MQHTSWILITLAYSMTQVIFSFADISWNIHTIDNNTHGTASVYACDLDNDGDKDVLGAVLEEHKIVWWRNDGGSPFQWTKFTIAVNFIQAISVYAADLNSDGDTDIIGAASYGDEISWWKNNGGDPLQWTKYVIRSNYDFAHEVYAYDLDMDEDLDILGAASDDNLISWWRNDGGDPIVWTEYTISDSFDGAKSVRVGDLDDDGDYDVVGACLYGDDITWWRNDGGDPIQWTEFTIDDYFNGAHRVQVIDIDKDQDLDILAVAYYNNEIAWYRNDRGDPLTWTKQTIGSGFVGACIAQAVDLDGDLDLDVVGSAQVSGEVAWWRNDGGDPIIWTKCYVDPNLDRAWPLYIYDIDEDGDPDVIAASSWAGTNQVNWYENISSGIIEDHNMLKATGTGNLSATIISGPFPLTKDRKCRIYTVSGQTIDPSNVPAGIYYISENGIIIQKIIKIK